jgi:hypothetical protein
MKYRIYNHRHGDDTKSLVAETSDVPAGAQVTSYIEDDSGTIVGVWDMSAEDASSKVKYNLGDYRLVTIEPTP